MPKHAPLPEETLVAIKNMLAAGASDKEILAAFPIHRSTLWRLKTNRQAGRAKITSLPVTESLLYSILEIVLLDMAAGKYYSEIVLPSILNIPAEWGICDIKTTSMLNSLTGRQEQYIIRSIEIKKLFVWLENNIQLPFTWKDMLELRAKSRDIDKLVMKEHEAIPAPPSKRSLKQ